MLDVDKSFTYITKILEYKKSKNNVADRRLDGNRIQVYELFLGLDCRKDRRY